MNGDTPTTPPPSPSGPTPTPVGGPGYPAYGPNPLMYGGYTRPPSRAGCYVAVGLALLLGCVAFSLMLLVTSLAGQGLGGGQLQFLEQEVTGTSHSPNKILRLQMHGAIMGEGGGVFAAGGAESWSTIRKFLDAVRQDRSVQGILLDVDSPGGAVTECDLIVHEFTRFRADMKKAGRTMPIVALYGDMAASGGYYISAGCDYIYCGRTTITGSIGVIMSFLNFSGLAKEYGVSEVVIKSGKMKNLLSRFEAPGDEEKAILQNTVAEMHARFVDVVAEGRLGKQGLTRERIAELADGRIYTPSQAKEYGLVDDIGYFDDAVDKIKSLAGISDARVIEYQKTRTLMDALTGSAALRPAPSTAQELLNAIKVDAPRAMYLWTGR